MFYTGTVVQLISVAVHFFGMSLKHEAASGQEKMLDDLMHSYRFDLGAGFVRTMSDFLTGFGLVYGVLLLFLGLINLFAIRQAGDSRFLRSLCWLNVMCMATVSAIAFKFFFLPPLLFAIVPLLAFLGAAVMAPRHA
jgi:fatty acid desaturase